MAKDKNQKKKTLGSSAQDPAENAHAQAENAHAQAENAHAQAENAHNQAENAHNQAEKDMLNDPELSDPDPTDDLDEGELARRDNSDEEALDYLERPRHGGEGHGGTRIGEKGHGGTRIGEKGHGGTQHAEKDGHSGKGKEK